MGINKDEAVKKIQESDKTEFEVFTADEHTTFLDNFKESTVDKELKEHVGKIHQQYDDDIYELTGKRKKSDQKTYNFLKEVIVDYKDKDAKSTGYENEITELKEKIKNNTGDETLKKDLAKVQQLYKDDKKTWESEKTTLISSHQRTGMENVLDRSLTGVKFKDTIPESARKMVLSAVKNELLESATMVDGVMIFTDKDGETLRNKDNGLNPYTAEEMLMSKLSDIIDTGRKIEGTGAEVEITEDDKGNKTINYTPSSSVKTKGDLSKDLAARGLISGSKEYMLAYAKYSEGLKYE